MEIFTLALILLIGLATGFVDSVVGSGGLISIPFLIFSGLPPHVAIATDIVNDIIFQTYYLSFTYSNDINLYDY